MGRVKSMMMDQEEKFIKKIDAIIGECETWHEFTSRMESHMHLVDHHPLDETMDVLAESWSLYWEKHQ